MSNETATMVVGQRYLSEREPELGLGVIIGVDRQRIGIEFPATGEMRIYATGTGVLKRVTFRVGESVATKEGVAFVIDEIVDDAGVLTYVGVGHRLREDAISDVTNVDLPPERLLAGQADPSAVFDLRQRALEAQARFRSSPVRGFLGGRLELIPHQFYILHEVSRRQIPRVLLADEVGLGKTIEACLILQRLLAVGKVRRALILVPEPLVHQWFVELLRRFNLWFSIFDEERCAAAEASDEEANPFRAEQLALVSVAFLAGDEKRAVQAVSAGWDLVIVDEAHHLEWSPTEVSPEYKLVESLAAKAHGLLLLTATPTQLGQEGHFARLRLLDPARYGDFDRFKTEAESYGPLAAVVEKITVGKALAAKDRKTLQTLFAKDPTGLTDRLEAVDAAQPGARDELLRTLLDQHGPGRVVFRNTRTAMQGFPQRQYCPEVVPAESPTQLTRIAREFLAEETGTAASVRYNFNEDPRIEWLIDWLQANRTAKALLICKSARKVLALEAAMREQTAMNIGLFHEELPLVQRDRQAAWFAEPDGARLLLCSEIGSEGRNFQFAHHVILWDLPLNPGLVEQRIGRLDRIGQTETIRIHVPIIEGSADAAVADWYHRGLDAFAAPLHGGAEYQAEFRERVLALAEASGQPKSKVKPADWEALITDTQKFRAALTKKLTDGRDRLLELNSFNPVVAEKTIEAVREADADPFLSRYLTTLLDHFGVRISEYEGGEFRLDASHAYVESFPGIPADGMLATYDRRRAITREDIVFLSADHSLVQDATDLLLNVGTGTTAFGVMNNSKPNLLLEVVFVLETVADSRWHVDQFLAPTPVRVVVDLGGADLTSELSAPDIAKTIEDADISRFLEQPGFNSVLLKNMVGRATEVAEQRSGGLKVEAAERASKALNTELERLEHLAKLNDAVRPAEVELMRAQLRNTRKAIVTARLRLDSLRLVLAKK